jgi:hypothetical protein
MDPTASKSSFAPNKEKPEKAENVTEFIFYGGRNIGKLLQRKDRSAGA